MEGDDEGVYRLAGTQNEVGGLIIKKKPAPKDSFVFKVPQTSLLGLDKLAGKNRTVFNNFLKIEVLDETYLISKREK
jgi:hypothetical protein